jgi:hypothetical protein
MIVSFQDNFFQNNQYFGNSVREIFSKFWKDKKGENVYSDNEQVFLRKVFEAMMMHIFNKKMSNMIKRETTDTEEKEFNQTVEAIQPFLAELEEREFLQPKYLFAYGKITNTIRISETTKAVGDEINAAQKDLERIMPEILVLMLREFGIPEA